VTDLRYAVRTLLRAPGFTLSAVLALALGIGANTAVFSVVYAVLLKPLPYPHPEQLVQPSERNLARRADDGRVSRGMFVDWQARARSITALAAYSSSGEALWTIGDQIQVVTVAGASPNLLAVLSVRPILGNWFPADQNASGSPGVVISYGLWQRGFGGTTDVVGRRIVVEGRASLPIIGVMPRGFAFPEHADAWTNIAPGTSVPPSQRRYLYYHAVARIAPGYTIQDVRRELDALSAQVAAEHPDSDAGWSARVVPLANADTTGARPALMALLCAVAGVLLIACANVANLLLARATARRRETAVRIALGAGAGRILRYAAAEAALLAAGGVVSGIVLAGWLSGVLVRLAPPDIPRLEDVRVTLPVLLFATIVGLASALATACAAALHAIRTDVRGGVRPDSRAATPRASRVRRLLVGGEVAVVVLLLTGALLLLRTFVKLQHVSLGFESAHSVSVETRWPVGRLFGAGPRPHGRPWPAVQRAVAGLIDAVAATPGVQAVGLTADVPLTGTAYDGTVWRSDAPGAHGLTPPTDPRDRWTAELTVVTSGYFRAMNVPVLRGRNFNADDTLSDEQLNDASLPRRAVAIVNAAFASRYFAGQDPIARSIVVYDDQEFGVEKTIVGVVADFHRRAIADAPGPAVFLPHEQHPDVFRPSLVVRSSLPLAALGPELRASIHAFDPQLLVLQIRPMGDVVSGALARPRFNLLLLASFALVALALAAVGIYGVIAFLVAQRTREVGIRVALGAPASSVVGLFVRDGMVPVAAGAVMGVAGSLIVARAIRSLLFGVTPLDFVSLAGAPALLVLVALAACYLPARRALAVDPIVALREE
jgi:putative ABC transport system permease protein